MSFITYFPLRANSMDLRAVVLEVVVVTRKDAFSSKVSALNTKIFTPKQQNIGLLLYKILSAQTYVRITTDTHRLNGHFFRWTWEIQLPPRFSFSIYCQIYCILSGQTQTHQNLLDTVQPSLPQTSALSRSINLHRRHTAFHSLIIFLTFNI